MQNKINTILQSLNDNTTFYLTVAETAKQLRASIDVIYKALAQWKKNHASRIKAA